MRASTTAIRCESERAERWPRWLGIETQQTEDIAMSAYDTTTGRTTLGGQIQDEHVEETHSLISADKVKGTSVYNAAGDNLGSIHDVMIDKRSGHVAYAVLSFGGFLGIGEKYHPLPWNVLTYDEDKGGYNIDLTADQLRAAPSYSGDELSRFGTDADESRLATYYGGIGGSPLI
jgi:sporulation protein YlmC with PRC-barrel domain